MTLSAVTSVFLGRKKKKLQQKSAGRRFAAKRLTITIHPARLMKNRLSFTRLHRSGHFAVSDKHTYTHTHTHTQLLCHTNGWSDK